MAESNPKASKAKRRNHFTPVLYLTNFVDSEDALHVISLVDGHRYATSPDNLGLERDLYRPGNLADGEDPNVYEDEFARFEGEAAPTIQRIIAERQMPEDEERLQLLFNFIAFQAVRTPSMRRVIAAPLEQEARIILNLLESSRELYEGHMRQAGYDLERHPYEKFVQRKGKYEPRLTTGGFLEGAMTTMTTTLQFLHRRTWSILTSDRPGEPFVVSDHPVSLTWSDGRETRVRPGHAHHHTDVSFPLSSNVALVGRYEALAPDQTTANVAALNSKTVNQARTFVAACSDDFVLMRGADEVVYAEQFIEDLKAGRVEE